MWLCIKTQHVYKSNLSKIVTVAVTSPNTIRVHPPSLPRHLSWLFYLENIQSWKSWANAPVCAVAQQPTPQFLRVSVPCIPVANHPCHVTSSRHSPSWPVVRRRHHRHRWTFYERIKVLCLFASHRSPCFASFLFVFYCGFHLFSCLLLLPPPKTFHYSFRLGSPCFSFASSLFDLYYAFYLFS